MLRQRNFNGSPCLPADEMGKVLAFPGSRSLHDSLRIIRGHLKTAGLNEQQIEAAMKQVEPAIEPLFAHRAFAFEVPSSLGLTEEQGKAVVAAHVATFDQVEKAYMRDLGYAVLTIAGLIGREHFKK